MLLLYSSYLHSGLVALRCGLAHGHGGAPAAVLAPVGEAVVAASAGEVVPRVDEEGARDQGVEDDGDEQREQVEEDDVGEEHDEVLGTVAAQAEAALGHVARADHAERPSKFHGGSGAINSVTTGAAYDRDRGINLGGI